MNEPCAAQLDGCQGRAAHTHHRKLRSQGGDNSPANLLPVCFRCHEWIHQHPRESYKSGLLVASWDDPALNDPRDGLFGQGADWGDR